MNVNKTLANTVGIYSALQIKNISPACLVEGMKKKTNCVADELY